MSSYKRYKKKSCVVCGLAACVLVEATAAAAAAAGGERHYAFDVM
jgi:hypothetical protein